MVNRHDIEFVIDAVNACAIRVRWLTETRRADSACIKAAV